MIKVNNVKNRNESTSAAVLVTPSVFLLIAFLLVPMIYTVYFSVFRYQIMRPQDITFINFENYTKLFRDKDFWQAFKNTIYFTVVVVPVQTALALGLALLVAEKTVSEL